MEWIDGLAEWVLFPLLIIYGITSWAKDHPNQNPLDPFPVDDSKKQKDPSDNTLKGNDGSH